MISYHVSRDAQFTHPPNAPMKMDEMAKLYKLPAGLHPHPHPHPHPQPHPSERVGPTPPPPPPLPLPHPPNAPMKMDEMAMLYKLPAFDHGRKSNFGKEYGEVPASLLGQPSYFL